MQTQHILVSATVPGLLAALDAALVGARGVTALQTGEDVARRIEDHARPLDAIVLDDTIQPYDGQPIENTLWDLIALCARRPGGARVLLLLRDDAFPPHIRDALVGGAQQTGGDALLLPPHTGEREHAQSVRWAVEHLHLKEARRQRWLMALSGSGGVGKSTQIANLAIAIARRGYRVLMVDADFAGGSLLGFFKVPPGAVTPFLSLREEFPELGPSYPPEAVERLIYRHHPSNIHMLFSGRGMIEVQDMNARAMQALMRAIQELPYDVVCLDAGPDVKARPYALDVLHGGGTGIVICPPGRKELNGAVSILELMRHMNVAGGNASLLTQAAVLYMEPERGHVARIDEVQAQVQRQYPDATDLGIIPRDAPTVSRISELREWQAVFDLAPHSPYARSIDAACTLLLSHLRLADRAQGTILQGESRGWLARLFGRREQQLPGRA